MRRSRILAGREQQRSRAKLRGRLDKVSQGDDADDSATAERLRGYLSASYSAEMPLAELERLDLGGYLDATSEFELSSSERLRQLAVHLEEAAFKPQPRGWLALARIYEFAERLAQERDELWEVLRSTAISATYFAVGVGDEAAGDVETRKRLFGTAYSAALRMPILDPDRAGSYSLLAEIRSKDPDGDLEQALLDADKALELDPQHGWAAWRRASVLHDLSRWREASEAYGALDASFFVGPRAGQYESVLEARAYCRLRAGDKPGALREFEALVTRYEENPHLAEHADWWYVVEVATGRLRDEIGARAKPLVARYADWLLYEFEEKNHDDPDYLDIVDRILCGAVREQAPEHVVVVKIDHWFGQRWRGFVGKVLGIAGASRKRNFVIPPFHPNRVVGEWQFERQQGGSYRACLAAGPVHVHQTSEKNWRRRIHRLHTPSVWLWFSGKSMSQDRTSAMVYVVRGENDDEAWYIEHAFKDGAWRITKLIGVDRGRLEAFVDAPASDEPLVRWRAALQ